MFVLCTTFFPSSNNNVLLPHLSFVDDIENFENCPFGVDVHEDFLRKLRVQEENLMAIKSGESQSKAVYLEGCVLLLHYFVLEHIPNCGTELISVVSPRMLKWLPSLNLRA